MDKKTIIIFILGLLLLVAFIGWAASSQQNEQTVALSSPGVSALTAPERLYDFGTILMSKGIVSHTFTVTNSSNQAIEITGLDTSCMCTTAYVEMPNREMGPFGMAGMAGYIREADQTVKPGQSLRIKVVFDPNAHGPAGVGPIQREIYLHDSAGRKFELQISGLVRP